MSVEIASTCYQGTKWVSKIRIQGLMAFRIEVNDDNVERKLSLCLVRAY